MEFHESTARADALFAKSKLVAKGKTLAEAEIDLEWMTYYGTLSQRAVQDRCYGLTRYPYEPGPAVSAFAGGFFEHKHWPLRRALSAHGSIREVME